MMTLMTNMIIYFDRHMICHMISSSCRGQSREFSRDKLKVLLYIIFIQVMPDFSKNPNFDVFYKINRKIKFIFNKNILNLPTVQNLPRNHHEF